MDRIRKALDLARIERRRFEQSAAYEPAPEQPRATAHHAVEQREPSRAPVSIVYTRTRVFEPDPAVLEANRVVNPAGTEPASVAFRMLRTQVLQRLEERSWRTMAILSPGTHDGKTTLAINLAVSLANDHRHTVLLVDCDLKRPGVAAGLGITPEWGVDDVLTGRRGVEQCLYHPQGFDRLVVLPARASLEHSSEALSGPQSRALVSELRDRYPDRIVLFDLPPILGTDDALAFLPLVDCALVVAAEGATPRDDLMRSMELLRDTPVVGTVLNRASGVNATYG